MRKLTVVVAAVTVIAAAHSAGASTAEPTTSTADVAAATLSLTVGPPPSFGEFAPGNSKAYEAATTVTVSSTAGDATLTVHDASTVSTGHLVNGAFTLSQPLQARASSAAGTGTTTYADVGGTASPLSLVTYDGPVSDDTVSVQFGQSISANEPLRAGTYSKELTFTLSTTEGCSVSLSLAPGGGVSSQTASCSPETSAEATPPAEATTTVSGSVPVLVSLTVGAPPSFGSFTPCVGRTYDASTTANLISTLGDALLTVHDASSVATGHLVNGAASLPEPLRARAVSASSPGTVFGDVGGSASPLPLLTWSGPVSNDAISLQLRQLINATDALQTGTYAKELTLTVTGTGASEPSVSRIVVGGTVPDAAPTSCPLSTSFAISPASPNGANGWYKGDPPTVTLTATGGTGGVASTSYAIQGGPPQTYTGPFALPDGESVVVTYASADNAGNVEPTQTSAAYKIDTVAPSVRLTTPAGGAIYRQGSTVEADYSCVDGTSGVASCAGPVGDGGPIDTSTLGWHTFTVDATDVAGNEAAVSRSYYVAPTTTSEPQPSGAVTVSPGGTVRVGYDFKLPGRHSAVEVRFVQPQVVIDATCVASGAAASLVVPMDDASYDVAANDTAWLPSGDKKSDLVYQGTLTVPAGFCGGGAAVLGDARFSAGILAGEEVKLNYRWHVQVNGAGGDWTDASRVTPTLLP